MDNSTLVIDTVFFDLDGTFADTAPDLIQALNRLLRDEGREEMPFSSIRNYVSQGSAAMVRKGFPDSVSAQEFEQLRLKFLDYYAAGLCIHTALFPGIKPALEFIESNQLKWGVITNKPAWLTNPLIEAMALEHTADCVVSGDTTEQRKPHPMPLLHACELSGSVPNRCVYVGDDPRDIQAGRAAGMKTIVAGYGYIDAAAKPASWGADALFSHAIELIDWLKSINAESALA